MADAGVGKITQFLLDLAEPEPVELTRDDVIRDINAVQDELDQLEVTRERFNFKQFSDSEIVEILDSLDEQLKARKKFLGVK